jgi:hypothetical protein
LPHVCRAWETGKQVRLLRASNTRDWYLETSAVQPGGSRHSPG